jgi:hypothetical protein
VSVFVEDVIIAGDVSAGDVVMLPGASDAVLVTRVRLGQGGFIFTVVPADDRSGAERVVTLSTATRLRRHGRIAAG